MITNLSSCLESYYTEQTIQKIDVVYLQTSKQEQNFLYETNIVDPQAQLQTKWNFTYNFNNVKKRSNINIPSNAKTLLLTSIPNERYNQNKGMHLVGQFLNYKGKLIGKETQILITKQSVNSLSELTVGGLKIVQSSDNSRIILLFNRDKYEINPSRVELPMKGNDDQHNKHKYQITFEENKEKCLVDVFEGLVFTVEKSSCGFNKHQYIGKFAVSTILPTGKRVSVGLPHKLTRCANVLPTIEEIGILPDKYRVYLTFTSLITLYNDHKQYSQEQPQPQPQQPQQQKQQQQQKRQQQQQQQPPQQQQPKQQTNFKQRRKDSLLFISRSTLATNDENDDGLSTTTKIILIVVGAIILIAIIIWLLWRCCVKKKKMKNELFVEIKSYEHSDGMSDNKMQFSSDEENSLKKKGSLSRNSKENHILVEPEIIKKDFIERNDQDIPKINFVRPYPEKVKLKWDHILIKKMKNVNNSDEVEDDSDQEQKNEKYYIKIEKIPGNDDLDFSNKTNEKKKKDKGNPNQEEEEEEKKKKKKKKKRNGEKNKFTTPSGLPGKTKKIQISDIRSNSFFIRWIEPSSKYSKIDGYELNIYPKFNKTKNLQIETTKKRIKFSNLKPNTEYNFNIKAKNKYGLGPKSTNKAAKTLVAKPSKIKNINVIEQAIDHVKINWSKPNDNGSKIDYYQIKFYKKIEDKKNKNKVGLDLSLGPETGLKLKSRSGSKPGSELEKEGKKPKDEENHKEKKSKNDKNELLILKSKNNKIQIPNLHPNREYSIKIQAHNAKGFGVESNTYKFNSLSCIPDKINELLNMKIRSKSIKFEWKEPKDNGEPIDYYRIKYKKIPKKKKIQIETDEKNKEELVTDPESDNGSQTKDKDEGKTIGIEKEKKKEKENENEKEKKNGNTKNKNKEKENEKEYKNDKKIKKENEKSIILTTKKKQISLVKLKPNQEYSIRIQAHNGNGFGNFSNPQKIKTKTYYPKRIQNFEINDNEQNNMKLSWNKTKKRGSEIDFYQLEFIPKSNNNIENKKPIIFKTKDLNFDIGSKLKPNKEYSVKIHAHNKNGLSKESCIPLIKCPPRVPNQVTKINCVEKNFDQLSLKWEIPKDNGSKIDYYRIKLSPKLNNLEEVVDDDKKNRERKKKNKNEKEYKNEKDKAKKKEKDHENKNEKSIILKSNKPKIVINDLNPNQEYSIIIQAHNENGFSKKSHTKKFKTLNGLADPIDENSIKMKIESTKAKFEWEEPNDNGEPIDYYEIELIPKNKDQNNKPIIFKTKKPEIEIPDLKPNQEYSIKIKAHNSNGSNKNSPKKSFITLSDIPDPIEEIKITEINSDFVELNWDKPNDNGSKIDYYQIKLNTLGEKRNKEQTINKHKKKYAKDPQEKDKEIDNKIQNDNGEKEKDNEKEKTFQSKKSEIKISNLNPNTKYSIKIQTHNKNGLGKESKAKEFKTLTHVPGIQMIKNIKIIKNKNITLTWDKPIDNGEPIDYYQIELIPKTKNIENPKDYQEEEEEKENENTKNKNKEKENEKEYKNDKKQTENEKAMILKSIKPEIEINNLKPNQEYSIQIQSHNSKGFGEKSKPIILHTPSDIPDDISEISLIKTTPNSLTVKWNEPKNNGQPINFYQIEFISESTEEDEQFDNDKKQNKDKNQKSTNSESESDSNSNTDSDSDKEINSNKRKDKKSISISENQKTKNKKNKIKTEKTEHEINNLKPNQKYSIKVKAHNTNGFSKQSPKKTFKTSTDIPEPIKEIKIQQINSNSIKLQWDKPNDNGSKIDYYQIKLINLEPKINQNDQINNVIYNEKAIDNVNKNEKNYKSEKQEIEISDLNPNETYIIIIQARNENGLSNESKPKQFKTLTGLANPIDEDSIKMKIESTKAKFEWKKPNDNGEPIDYYEIELTQNFKKKQKLVNNQFEDENKKNQQDQKTIKFNQKEDDQEIKDKKDIEEKNNKQLEKKQYTEKEKPIIIKTKKHMIEINNLNPNQKYLIKIKAHNANGLNEQSPKKTFKTSTDIPEPIKEIKIQEINSNFVELQWDKPKDNGSKIDYYQINLNNLEENQNENANIKSLKSEKPEMKISDLNPNEKYSIKIQAHNENGLSKDSKSREFKTLTGVSNSIDNDSIKMKIEPNQTKIEWKEPNDNGEPIDYYQIELIPKTQNHQKIKDNQKQDEEKKDKQNQNYNKEYEIEKEYQNEKVKNHENKNEKSIILKTHKPEIEINDLKPNQEYSIQIQPHNSKGFGEKSEPMILHTSSDIPDDISEISLIKTTPNSLTVKWNEPKNNGQPINFYQIEFISESTEEDEQFDNDKKQNKDKNQKSTNSESESDSNSNTDSDSDKEINSNKRKDKKSDSISENQKTKNKKNKIKTEKTEHEINNLKPNQKYSIKVKAHNANGFSKQSPKKTFKTSTDIPEPIEEIKIQEINSNFVELQWDKPNDNGSKIDYYQTKLINLESNENKKENSIKKIIKSEKPEMKISDLSPNEKYSIKIQAHNENGLSNESKPKEFKTLSDSPNPIDEDSIKMKIESTKAKIEWKEPNDNGEPIDYYEIKLITEYDNKPKLTENDQKEDEDKENKDDKKEIENYKEKEKEKDEDEEKKKSIILKTKKPEIEIFDLTPNQKYSIKIKPHNANGLNKNSKPKEFKTLTDIPDTIEEIKIQEINSDSVELKWNKPKDNGSKIDYYQIEINSEIFLQPIRLQTETEKIEINDLKPCEKYSIKIQSHNENGLSKKSKPKEFKTLSDSPNSIENHSIVELTSNKISIKWKEAKDNGEPIDFYKIKLYKDIDEKDIYKENKIDKQDEENKGENEKNKEKNSEIHKNESKKEQKIKKHKLILSTKKPEIEINNLTPNQDYSFKIKAHNTQGFSKNSELTKFKTLSDVPDQIEEIKINELSANMANIEWGEPNNNGEPIDYYQLDLIIDEDNQNSDKDENELYSKIYKIEKPKIEINGLKSNQQYFIKIRAHNPNGFSIYSREKRLTTSFDIPNQINELNNFENTANKSIWGWAHNEEGFGKNSETKEFNTLSDIPNSIDEIKIIEIKPNSVELKWDEPKDNGEQIDCYQIEIYKKLEKKQNQEDQINELKKDVQKNTIKDKENKEVKKKYEKDKEKENDEDEDEENKKPIKVLNCETPRIQIIDLNPNEKYTIQIQAHNENGFSGKSEHKEFKTLTDSPNSIDENSIKMKIDSNKAKFKWEKPIDNGEPIDYYQIELINENENENEEKIKLKTEIPEIEIKDLKPNQEYSIKIKPHNSNGFGAKSPKKTLKTLTDIPEPIDKIKITELNPNFVGFKWNKPDDNGSEIDYYQIKLNNLEKNENDNNNEKGNQNDFGKEQILKSKKPEMEISDINPNEKYSIKIQAHNGNGFSKESEPKEFKTLTDLADPIDEDTIKMKIESTKAKIKWEKPNDNGEPIDYYQIELISKTVYKKDIYNEKKDQKQDEENKDDKKEKNNKQRQEKEKYEEKDKSIILKTEKTKIKISNLNSNKEYSIKIKPHNSNGLNEKSPKKEFKTLTDIPEPIKEIKITELNPNFVELKWNKPKDNGSEIDFYQIKLKNLEENVNQNEKQKTIKSEKPEMKISKLNPNEKYSIKIQAHNENGFSKNSNPKEFKTLTDSPNSIDKDSIKISEIEPNKVLLEFKPPKDNGEPIDFYEIELISKPDKKENEKQNIKSILLKSQETKVEIPDLKPNQDYSIKIKPHNSKGFGKESAIKSFKTSIDVPDQIKNIDIKNLRSKTIKFKCDKPKDNGSEIDYYQIKLINLEEKQNEKEKIIKSEKPEIEISELNPNEKYSIKIQAHNEEGFSKESEPKEFKTLTDIPDQINNISIVELKSTKTNCKWEKPNDNGEPIDYYQIKIKTKDPKQERIILKTEKPEIEISDLKPNQEYSIKVKPHNSNGIGKKSEPKSFKTLTDIPDPIDQIKITELSADSVELEWIIPNDNGSDIDHYKIKLINLEGKQNDKEKLFKSEKTEIKINDLKPNKKYLIKIQAHNENGFSKESEPKKFKTLTDVPNSIENHSIVELNPNKIKLEWNEPKNNGETIDYYHIELIVESNEDQDEDTDENEKEKKNKNYKTKKPEIEIQNLKPNQKYQFKIKAHNSNGLGKDTNKRTFKTSTDIPDPIDEIIINKINSNSIEIEWQKPNDNGSEIDHYQIEFQNKNNKNQKPKIIKCKETTLKNEQLKPNEKYSIQIQAHNDNGFSKESDPKEFKTLTNVSDPIDEKSIQIQTDSNKVNLNWEKPTNNGETIDYYEIEIIPKDKNKKPIILKTKKPEIEIPDLEPNQEYSIKVKAHNSKGFGKQSRLKAFKTLSDIPEPIKEIKIINLNPNSVELKWNKPKDNGSEIDFYQIKLINLEENQNEKQKTLKSKKTKIEIPELKPNEKYSIIIQAHNENGFSNESKPKEFKTLTDIPEIIQILTNLEVEPTKVKLNWEEPNDNGEPIDYYQVDILPKDKNKKPIIVKTKKPEIEIPDLKPNQEYSIKIKPHNSKGFGKESKLFPFSTSTHVPKPIKELVEKKIGSRFSKLKWNKPKDNGEPIDYYKVEILPNNAQNKKPIILKTKKPEIGIPNLKPNQKYLFKIKAHNANGFGNDPKERIFNTLSDIPDPIHEIKIIDLNPNSVKIELQKPKDNGSEIDYYQIELKKKNNEDTKPKIIKSKKPEIKINDLNSNAKYSIQIQAHNGNGFSKESQPKEFKTLTSVSDPIDENSIQIQTDSNKIKLNWKAPNDNGEPIDYYEIEIIPKDKNKEPIIFKTKKPGIEIPDLEPNQEYSIELKSHNSNGFGKKSPKKEFKTLTDIPEPIKEIKITDLNPNSVGFKWNKPEDNGSEIDYYRIEFIKKKDEKKVKKNEKPKILKTKKPEIDIPELTPNEKYSIKIQAHNDNGLSKKSKPKEFKTLSDSPNSIDENSIKIQTDSNKVKLNWEKPNDNGESIDYYQVELIPKDKNKNKPIIFKTKKPEIEIPDLKPNQEYSIKIKPHNSKGLNKNSPKKSFNTSTDIPDPIEEIKITELSTDSVKFKWNKPNDNGSGIDHYQIKLNNLETNENEKTLKTKKPEINIPELKPNQNYSIEIQAHNEQGFSKKSEPKEFKTLTDLPHPIKEDSIKIMVEQTKAKLKWNEPNDNGEPIDYYQIELIAESNEDQDGDTDEDEDEHEQQSKYLKTKKPEIEINDLNPNQEYQFKIKAHNSNGFSRDFQEEKSFKTLTDIPDQIEDIKIIKIISNEVKLKWNKPNDNGEPIEFYQIEIYPKGETQMIIKESEKPEIGIKNLKANQDYSIQIKAHNEKGFNKPSKIKHFKTLADIPDQIKKIQILNISSHQVNCKWKKPNDNGEPINYYKIALLKLNDNISDQEPLILKTEKPEIEINDLKSNQNYKIAIFAHNKIGFSKKPGLKGIKTSIYIPDQILKPKINKIGADYVNLEWKEPKNNGSEIDYYQIKLKNLVENENANEIKKTLKSTKPNIEIKIIDLKPNNKYSSKIQAHNEKGFSKESEPAEFKTLTDAPYSIDEDSIKILEIKPNQAKFEWKEPQNNGEPIDYYQIELIPTSDVNKNPEYDQKEDQDEEDQEKVKDNENDEEKEKEKEQEQENKKQILLKTENPGIEISNLKPNQDYSIKIKAHNSNGFSQDTKPFNIKTSTGVPGQITDIEINEINPDSVELKWEEPNANGSKIKHYRICYRKIWRKKKWKKKKWKKKILKKIRKEKGEEETNEEKEEEQEREQEQEIQCKTPFIKISKLEKDQEYEIAIQAQNEFGDSIKSELITFKTLQGPPGQIPKIVCFQSTTDLLKLKWTKPKSESSPIDFYKITVILTSDEEKIKENRNKIQEDSDEDDEKVKIKEGEYIIKNETNVIELQGLEPGQRYPIRISAHNDFGYGRPKLAHFTTKVGLPDQVKNVRASETKTRFELKIEWDKPNGNGSEILNYTIYIFNKEQELTKTTISNKTVEILQQIQPKKTYSIQVAANTEVETETGTGTGEFSEPISYKFKDSAAPKIEDTSKLIDEQVSRIVHKHNLPFTVKQTRKNIGSSKEVEYQFGTKKIRMKLLEGYAVIRVGGGFMKFDEFVKTHAGPQIRIMKKEGRGFSFISGKERSTGWIDSETPPKPKISKPKVEKKSIPKENSELMKSFSLPKMERVKKSKKAIKKENKPLQKNTQRNTSISREKKKLQTPKKTIKKETQKNSSSNRQSRSRGLNTPNSRGRSTPRGKGRGRSITRNEGTTKRGRGRSTPRGKGRSVTRTEGTTKGKGRGRSITRNEGTTKRGRGRSTPRGRGRSVTRNEGTTKRGRGKSAGRGRGRSITRMEGTTKTGSTTKGRGKGRSITRNEGTTKSGRGGSTRRGRGRSITRMEGTTKTGSATRGKGRNRSKSTNVKEEEKK
ncbi:fibronectin type iii domain-containing 3ba-related [Anaeramoeba flamelloides]|uniref:Fibronectin type iii domain-containing 3ba-related n=1 Tax=Anaeramoeba flamelloides TaxID=1746091 RepID=A0AAV8AA97_9EUKA|nr:fibronectin type iii domain-containing 3ba-related [Anaeramoeba flamelloides]